jgi:hypothetical protein
MLDGAWPTVRRITGLAMLLAVPFEGADVSAGAAEDPGSIGVRLVDVPADTVTDPRAQLYIVDHLAPGTTIERRVEVSNTTGTSLEIELYSAAATVEAGAFLGAAGHSPNDLSTWTSADPESLAVPSGATQLAMVTIAVPSDAAPGEQFAVVWAEARVGPADDSGVTTITRAGIRIYLSVGQGNPPAADFVVDSLTASRSVAGEPVVVAAVHNTGGRALDIHGTLQLSAGPGGLGAGPFPATLGTTIVVGATEMVTVALDERVPNGPWHAAITLHSGLLERVAEATITFPNSGSAPPVTTSSPPESWFVFGAIALLLLTGAVVLYRRTSRPRRGGRHAPGQLVEKGR